MGCAQSKVDNEESVSRCKERKILMKEAVLARNAFAAGHSGYSVALKDTGAALSDYAHGEAEQPPPDQLLPHQFGDVAAPPPPPPPPQMIIENLPPPPPLPNFSPFPIKRALSMPEIKMNRNGKGKGKDSIAIMEEEEEEEGKEEEEHEEEELDHGVRRRNGKKSDNAGLVNGHRGPQNEKVQVSPPQTPPPPAGGHLVPPMPEAKSMAWDYFFTVDPMPGPSLDPEEHIVDNVATTNDRRFGDSGAAAEVEPKTPERMELAKAVEEVVEKAEVKMDGRGKQIEHSKTAPPEFRMVGGMKGVGSVPSVNLMQVLTEIDDHFLKASESAQEVSKMLEATRLHYHSNFADNRGHIDHSARVMRVITWNRSFRGVPGGEGGKDDLDSEDYETHATILDKLLAWEKKLYDEVKQGEHMKLEYKRKVALLNKQKKRGASPESLEKTKAAVSHLHTRYIVDMQSMDSTVSEVSHIRDEQLYPRLVALVDGMAKMWAKMCIHHDSQLKIVMDLKSLDVAHDVKETTKHHHERTKQLHKVVQDWHSQFEKLMTYQKQYIRVLNSWLKLNLIPIESSLKEKVTSPPRVQNPPIHVLLQSWNDHLEKLPDELAKSAISSFAALIKTIIDHQEEEMKLREKCEETRKELLRKSQAFDDWYQKYMQRRNPSDEAEGERCEETNPKDPVTERQFAVESLKKRLEEEVEAHRRCCLQVREKSLGSLKIRLPELFRAMLDYSRTCSEAYERLGSITQPQRSNHVHPQ